MVKMNAGLSVEYEIDGHANHWQSIAGISELSPRLSLGRRFHSADG